MAVNRALAALHWDIGKEAPKGFYLFQASGDAESHLGEVRPAIIHCDGIITNDCFTTL